MSANTRIHVCDVTTSRRHCDNNCNPLRLLCTFEIVISENRPFRSHRCPADTNKGMIKWEQNVYSTFTKVFWFVKNYICSHSYFLETPIFIVDAHILSDFRTTMESTLSAIGINPFTPLSSTRGNLIKTNSLSKTALGHCQNFISFGLLFCNVGLRFPPHFDFEKTNGGRTWKSCICCIYIYIID